MNRECPAPFLQQWPLRRFVPLLAVVFAVLLFYIYMETSNIIDRDSPPQAILGLVADIQYADKDDLELKKHRWDNIRKYRQCLPKLEEAVKAWQKIEKGREKKITIAQLGDLVDGYELQEGKSQDFKKTRADLEKVLEIIEEGGWGGEGSNGTVLHVIGNHCLEAGREFLSRRMKMRDGWWYSKPLDGGWMVVVLDTMDVSMSSARDTAKRKQAEKWLEEHAEEANAEVWNGMPGEEQLKWLKATLKKAKAQGKKVVVLGHHPLIDGDDGKMEACLAWNSDRTRQILEEGGVKLYISGHCHFGGYAGHNNVHYVTLESIVDSDDRGSYGVMRLYESRIVIDGAGCMTSRTLNLKT